MIGLAEAVARDPFIMGPRDTESMTAEEGVVVLGNRLRAWRVLLMLATGAKLTRMATTAVRVKAAGTSLALITVGTAAQGAASLDAHPPTALRSAAPGALHLSSPLGTAALPLLYTARNEDLRRFLESTWIKGVLARRTDLRDVPQAVVGQARLQYRRNY